MLDEALRQPGSALEIEDIMGEDVILPVLNAMLPAPLSFTAADRKAGSLPDQIKAAAKRQGIALPEGWKTAVALTLVSSWAQVRIPTQRDR